MPNIKVYEKFGSVVVELPNNRFRTFLPNSGLSASLAGDNISISNNDEAIVVGLPPASILNEAGAQFAPTRDGTRDGLNSLFSNSNPSDLATASSVSNLVSKIKILEQSIDDSSGGGSSDGDGDSGGGGDVWVISVTGAGTNNGKVKVRENSTLMSVQDNEVFVDGEKVKFSVKSNTGNLGSEAKSEAIVITGEESSANSIVDMKGSMKFSRSPESKFVMDNTLTTNGRVSFSGTSTYLSMPEGASYSNNLMVGKSVIIGDADNELNKGERNYFVVKGLSTGDIVDVQVKVVVVSDASHTIVLDDNRTTQSSSVATNTIGQAQTVTVSMNNVVDNYSDIAYHLNLTTLGSGNYRVSEIIVTIS